MLLLAAIGTSIVNVLVHAAHNGGVAPLAYFVPGELVDARHLNVALSVASAARALTHVIVGLVYAVVFLGAHNAAWTSLVFALPTLVLAATTPQIMMLVAARLPLFCSADSCPESCPHPKELEVLVLCSLVTCPTLVTLQQAAPVAPATKAAIVSSSTTAPQQTASRKRLTT